MPKQRCYPVLMVEDVKAAARFYSAHFGFEEAFATDWYVSLRHPSADDELAFLDPSHTTIPTGFGVASRGVLINIEVDDAATEYTRLVTDTGLSPVLELRDEDFGQRHFIITDPAGNLVDVIENIPPSDAFAAAYHPAAP